MGESADDVVQSGECLHGWGHRQTDANGRKEAISGLLNRYIRNDGIDT